MVDSGVDDPLVGAAPQEELPSGVLNGVFEIAIIGQPGDIFLCFER